MDSVVIVGTGRWNGRSGYPFEDSTGRVVANISDTLDGGNNQSTRLPGRR